MNTVAHARQHVADVVKGGSTPSCQAVLDAINRAQQDLLANQDLVDLTCQRMRFSPLYNMIACPACVERVVAYKTDGSPGVLPKSIFYEFLPGGSWSSDEVSGYKTDMVDWGDHKPTMFTIPADYAPLSIYAFCSDPADAGVKLFLDGFNENGWHPLTAGEYGTTVECVAGLNGVTITANGADLKPTAFKFSQITNVVKPVTQGYVALMCQYGTEHYWYNIAIYHPKDKNPSFHRYKLTQPRDDDGTCVVCLVKVRHVELIQDNDILLVQNLEALKNQILAHQYETANPAMADRYQGKAVAQIRRDVMHKTPDQDWTVKHSFGIGRIERM